MKPRGFAVALVAVHLTLWVCAGAVAFADDAEDPNYDTAAPVGRLDRWHQAIETGLRRTATWADSFFSDERYEAESNESRLRLRIGAFVEEGEGLSDDLDADLRIALPGTRDRIAFIVEGGSDESNDDRRVPADDIAREFRGNDDSNFSLGLRYRFLETRGHSILGQAGLELRSVNAQGAFGLRYRGLFGLGQWGVRFAERLRWFTDDGVETITTLDFDREVFGRMLFRHTLKAAWFEKEQGYFYEINFSLIQRLNQISAIQYECNNFFETEPNNHLVESVFRLRYRRQTYRDWLILEVAPQVAVPHDRDYEPTPGILLRAELTFGG